MIATSNDISRQHGCVETSLRRFQIRPPLYGMAVASGVSKKAMSLLVLFFVAVNCLCQITPWDDTQTKNWPKGFDKVDIRSTADGTLQPAIIHKSSKSGQPLIVSLHSWSGGYEQADSISWEIAARDWNYIHPHFRGPNWTPQACGSEWVVKDIDDAINYAVTALNAAPDEVHVVGSSGGGHAAMLCYAQLKYPVKSVNAWVGISNLVDWYYESIGRGQKYAKDILKATGDTTKLNAEEAKKRSPLFVPLNALAKQRQLFLYAGIHDGYSGSVPVTQTLQFYNRVVKEHYPSSVNTVTTEEMLELVTKRNFPSENFNRHTGDRKVHYFKQEQNISVNIFEGKHEQVVKSVLALLPIAKRQVNKALQVLCIGDSNGEINQGWVTQLQFELPYSNLVNKCKSGNTIGFDNGGAATLNELKNIERHLAEAAAAAGNQPFDFIIISLGTNDTKKEFANKQKTVARAMDALLQQIKASTVPQFTNAKIIVVTPPPVADDTLLDTKLLEKFSGASKRMTALLPKLEAVAKKNKTVLINTNTLLQPNWKEYSYDGIHYNSTGAQVVARAIGNWINTGE